VCNVSENKYSNLSKNIVSESIQILTSCDKFLKTQALFLLQLFAVIFGITTEFILHSLSEP